MKTRILLIASITSCALIGLVVATAVKAASPATKDAVTLERLTWDAFKTKLAKAKSEDFKYTVVDAWASNCGPCKENFPHLVEMHKKYTGKGLQVISLSLDDTSDATALVDAKKFLTEKKSTFKNIVLDEEFGIGFEKLEINSIPAVFIYGPDGKEVQRFTWDDPNNQFTYEQVDQALARLLGVKAAAK